MHIFFSGIGGTGIGPLALVAAQAGYSVSGSDKQDSNYIHYLHDQGIDDIHIGQDYESIKRAHEQQPIEWYVYSSAVAIEQPDAPEFQFCREHGIRMSKRDELLNEILTQKNLKLIAIAGTHGKTTTTAMAVWLAQRIGFPLSYILPAKSSFSEMGRFDFDSDYFLYECDEFDRNFLHFEPEISVVTGIDWDHPDIYPTRENYYQAFRDFLGQSQSCVLWQSDLDRLGGVAGSNDTVLSDEDSPLDTIRLAGLVNRRNAWQVARTFEQLTEQPLQELLTHLEAFPGVSRRFEQIAPALYSDYAHTPEKIRGALQLGRETAGDDLVVVYEGLHNTRQHFIRDDLLHLFDGLKQLYIVPSYLAREDESLYMLTPDKLRNLLSPDTQAVTEPAVLDDHLRQRLQAHLDSGDTVLCLSAGGGNSLDEWLRTNFASNLQSE